MTTPTYDEARGALYRVRDAHRETPDAFGRRIKITANAVRFVEREVRPTRMSALAVECVLRARELGQLTKAKPDDVHTLERWLATHEATS